MVTFNITDGMHIRKNPWRNTAFGKGEFYLASDPTVNSQAQLRQQEDLAQAAQENYSDCNGLDGTAKNACRARKISQALS